MNQLLIQDPTFYIGDNGHPFGDMGFPAAGKRVTCLLDTGFTLGFAFSKTSLQKFQFTNGYLLSMLLGNGFPTKGMAFIVELLVQQGSNQRSFGNTSVVFMDKQGEPLIGVETMKLWTPMTLDWATKTVQANGF